MWGNEEGNGNREEVEEGCVYGTSGGRVDFAWWSERPVRPGETLSTSWASKVGGGKRE